MSYSLNKSQGYKSMQIHIENTDEDDFQRIISYEGNVSCLRIIGS